MRQAIILIFYLKKRYIYVTLQTNVNLVLCTLAVSILILGDILSETDTLKSGSTLSLERYFVFIAVNVEKAVSQRYVDANM